MVGASMFHLSFQVICLPGDISLQNWTKLEDELNDEKLMCSSTTELEGAYGITGPVFPPVFPWESSMRIAVLSG